MNSSRSIRVPADGRGPDIDRTALSAVSELGLPTILRVCVSCRSTRLDTDVPFQGPGADAATPLEVTVRVERLLTAGFGLSRPALRGMVDSGRVRLPPARRREAPRGRHVPRPLRRAERPWRTLRRLYGMRRR